MKFQTLKLQNYPFLQNLKKISQASLLTVSAISLIFCQRISGYFANNDPEYWFDYFVITERFSMLMAVIAAKSYLSKINWIATELVTAFLIQDFLDRVFFDITTRGINDTIILTVIIIHFIIRIYAKVSK